MDTKFLNRLELEAGHFFIEGYFMTTQVFDLNDAAGKVKTLEWFMKAELVHRQLRSKLPQEYAEKMQRVFEQGGRMCVAGKSNFLHNTNAD